MLFLQGRLDSLQLLPNTCEQGSVAVNMIKSPTSLKLQFTPKLSISNAAERFDLVQDWEQEEVFLSITVADNMSPMISY